MRRLQLGSSVGSSMDASNPPRPAQGNRNQSAPPQNASQNLNAPASKTASVDNNVAAPRKECEWAEWQGRPHRVATPHTWLLPLRCDGSSYALQPGVRGLVRPAWRRAGPRPGAHGDQVTPGPTGNQLGGHGAVKDRGGGFPRHPRLVLVASLNRWASTVTQSSQPVPRPAPGRAEDSDPLTPSHTHQPLWESRHGDHMATPCRLTKNGCLAAAGGSWWVSFVSLSISFPPIWSFQGLYF